MSSSLRVALVSFALFLVPACSATLSPGGQEDGAQPRDATGAGGSKKDGGTAGSAGASPGGAGGGSPAAGRGGGGGGGAADAGTGGAGSGGADAGPPSGADAAGPRCEADPGGANAHALWKEWTAQPDTHAHIPNVGYAGYHNGDDPLPNPSGPVFDVKDPAYGAKGDGKIDDTAAVRKAIDAAANGGVVFFPDGEYLLSGPLFVHSNNTVLRGQSRAGTKLVFTKSLNDSYAVNLSGSSSRWSWAGGLVWFTPKHPNHVTYLPAGATTIERWNENWIFGQTPLATISGDPKRGARVLTVSDGSKLKAKEFVAVTVDNPADLSLLKHLTGDGPWADTYNWSDANSGQIKAYPTIDWVVQIESIAGNEVTLKQPLRFDLRPAWNPRLRSVEASIRESGIETLTVVLKRNYKWSFAGNHLKEPGWNGPLFNLAIDCFARGVTVVDPDTGFGVVASKNITLTDIRLESSNAERLDHHHGTTARELAHDVLVENFTFASKPWHGINTENFSMGNAWSKGTMEHGTFDTHRQLPYESVRTEITVTNDGTQGGGPNSGPQMGARFVNWNVEVTNNRPQMVCWADIMPKGAVVGVRGCTVTDPKNSECLVQASGAAGMEVSPKNLYEAQRQQRLCTK